MFSTCSQRCAGGPPCSSPRTSWLTSNASATRWRFSTSGAWSPKHPSKSSKHATDLSLIHISEPTRLGMISYAVFCLKKKKKKKKTKKQKLLTIKKKKQKTQIKK